MRKFFHLLASVCVGGLGGIGRAGHGQTIIQMKWLKFSLIAGAIGKRSSLGRIRSHLDGIIGPTRLQNKSHPSQSSPPRPHSAKRKSNYCVVTDKFLVANIAVERVGLNTR